MRLIPIPKDKYDEYRRRLMFDCYKWDPQFLDSNTIAKYALVISKDEHKELMQLTEELDRETRAAEIFLNDNSELAKPLELSRKLRNEIKTMKNYRSDDHIRLMRYDFHPTVEGKWAVSEVNSDVPGGFAEASLMPEIAIGLLESDEYRYKNFGEVLVRAISEKVVKRGRIMLVHCTCYSDDRQVMQFLGDRLKSEGYSVIYAAADHLRFKDNKAYSILDGNEGIIDAIIRFTPLEWLEDIKPKKWQGYFDTITVSCNHPVAIFAQTKRFPFVWDTLEKNGISMTIWRKLLPETMEVKAAEGKEGYIYKPAYGRVGEKISIKEACPEDEYKKIILDVKKHPKKYVAQKKFISRPLAGLDGEEFHVCLGSYTVNGEHAGYYARISKTPRIDSNAADIPVLICDDIQSDNYNKVPDCNLQTADNTCGKSNNAGKEMQVSATGNIRNKARVAYDIWAPAGKKWVDWVRPVPFVATDEYSKAYSFSGLTITGRDYIDENYKDAAIIVDLPGAESVKEGIELARLGYRPIPVFNGTIEQQGARATVDNQSVGVALLYGAAELDRIKISDSALPAFLLDSNRLNRYRMDVSVFDNSWDIYPQDIPSAEYMLNNGIKKIIIIGESLSKDLKKILYKYQKNKIQIFFKKEYGELKKITIPRPIGKDDF